MYIQTIADLYKRYLLFIEKAFDNDQSFLRILDRVNHSRLFHEPFSFIQSIRFFENSSIKMHSFKPWKG